MKAGKWLGMISIARNSVGCQLFKLCTSPLRARSWSFEFVSAIDVWLYRAGIAGAIAIAMSACSLVDAPAQDSGSNSDGGTSADFERSHTPWPLSHAISLDGGSQLARLASRIDGIAIEQSAAVHKRRAATAALKATRFELFPQVKPIGVAPLMNGEGTIGMAAEQTIWGGGA